MHGPGSASFRFRSRLGGLGHMVHGAGHVIPPLDPLGVVGVGFMIGDLGAGY